MQGLLALVGEWLPHNQTAAVGQVFDSHRQMYHFPPTITSVHNNRSHKRQSTGHQTRFSTAFLEPPPPLLQSLCEALLQWTPCESRKFHTELISVVEGVPSVLSPPLFPRLPASHSLPLMSQQHPQALGVCEFPSPHPSSHRPAFLSRSIVQHGLHQLILPLQPLLPSRPAPLVPVRRRPAGVCCTGRRFPEPLRGDCAKKQSPGLGLGAS